MVWCLYQKLFLWPLIKNEFGAVMNFFFWTKIYKIKEKCSKKIVFIKTRTFFNVLCSHKDKLVLHCINNILMDSLSRNEISCHKNLSN